MTKSLVWAEAPLMPGDLCEWFALCFEPATAYRDHPIIGKVPVCPGHLTFGMDVPNYPAEPAGPQDPQAKAAQEKRHQQRQDDIDQANRDEE